MKGFTLLELLMVVAIPAYQRYVAASQVTELVILMKAATRSLEIDYLLEAQALPDSLVGTPIKTQGLYVESLVVSENKFLRGCLRKRGVHSLVADSCLTVTYAQKDWWCVAIQVRGHAFTLPVPLEMDRCVEQVKSLV